MTDEFDFTDDSPSGQSDKASAAVSMSSRNAKHQFYDAALARQLFESTSAPELFAASQVIFQEHDAPAKSGLFSKAAPSRMYFIASGEVSLSANGRRLDSLNAGEIFGEMTVITGSPRSATATAKTDATLYSLDGDQLPAALQKASPEFALMLMHVMFDRLRLVAARLAARKSSSGKLIGREATEGEVFSAKMLKQLQDEMERPTVLRYPAGKTIMQQGEIGVTMYVLLEGRVAVHIGENRVETLLPGSTFGEMALVGQAPRTATVTARDDSAVLSLNRQSMIDLVKTNPAFALAILRAVAERLRYMNTLLK
jgi:CRP/FNR family transcriptional regulator, cyclic AMP receptor protein